MADIYARQKTAFAGSFSSDLAAMTLAGTTTALGIIQNVQITFSQAIARIYDVSNGGSNASAASGGNVPVFYVGGRTQGQATIARVLGPQSGDLSKFYEVIGNVCSPQNLTFTFQGGCAATAGTNATVPATFNNMTSVKEANAAKYTVEGAVMTSMGVTVGSQDMIVNENIQLMFANLKCDKG